ncbi:MAG TPA: hypothetical protein VIZ87_10660, partial [Terrimicrobium sp.]
GYKTASPARRRTSLRDEVGVLPEVEHSLSLSAGDDLILTSVEIPGKAAEYDEEDEVTYQPAQIGCSLPAVFTDARPGERIFFRRWQDRGCHSYSPQ